MGIEISGFKLSHCLFQFMKSGKVRAPLLEEFLKTDVFLRVFPHDLRGRGVEK